MKFINFSTDIYISPFKNQRKKRNDQDILHKLKVKKQLVHIREFQCQNADIALFISRKKISAKKEVLVDLEQALSASPLPRLLRIFYNLSCNFTRLPILQHHCVQPWLLFRIRRKRFPQGWMNNTTLSIQQYISWHLHEDACDIPLSTRRYFSRIDHRLAPYISVQRSEYLVPHEKPIAKIASVVTFSSRTYGQMILQWL